MRKYLPLKSPKKKDSKKTKKGESFAEQQASLEANIMTTTVRATPANTATFDVYSTLTLDSIDLDMLQITNKALHDQLTSAFKRKYAASAWISMITDLFLNLIPWANYKDDEQIVLKKLKADYPNWQDLEGDLRQTLQLDIAEDKTVVQAYFIPAPPKEGAALKKRLVEAAKSTAAGGAISKLKTEQQGLSDGDAHMATLDQSAFDRQTLRVMTGQLHIRAFQAPEDILETPEQFERWLKKIENSMGYHGIATDDEKHAAMLEYGGDSITDIEQYGTLPQDLKQGRIMQMTSYQLLVAKLRAHFIPFDTKLYYRFKFLQMRPEHNEQIGSYLVRLRKAAARCRWDESKDHNEDMILLIILLFMEDKKLQVTALSENYDLMQLVKKKGAKEVSQRQSNYVTGKVDEMLVKKVQKPQGSKQDQSQPTKTIECKFCGYDYPHRGGTDCPAKGKKCNNCQGMNHFQKKCPSKGGADKQSTTSKADKKNFKKKGKQVKKAEAQKEDDDNDDPDSDSSGESFSK